MVILGLECRSCGKLFNELYGNAVSDKSLARPTYSRDGVARGKHGFSSSNVLLLCCSREFLWYHFYFRADGVPERRGAGRRGGPGGKTHLF